MIRHTGWFLLSLCLFFTNGCTTPPTTERVAINASDQLELRTDMHELWHYLIELDHSLAPPPEQQDVLFSLGELSRVANAIDVKAVNRQHAFFPAQLDQFVATLNQATAAAKAAPPDYQPALRVVDACGRCHIVRREVEGVE